MRSISPSGQGVPCRFLPCTARTETPHVATLLSLFSSGFRSRMSAEPHQYSSHRPGPEQVLPSGWISEPVPVASPTPSAGPRGARPDDMDHIHFGFTILLNSPNEFVRSHAGCGHQRPGRLSESRELVGANPVWISVDASIRSDPAGGGARRHSSASGRCSRDLTAHPGSQHPAVHRQTAHRGRRPARRTRRSASRDQRAFDRSSWACAIRNPYPNLIVECPFTCQRLVGGPR